MTHHTARHFNAIMRSAGLAFLFLSFMLPEASQTLWRSGASKPGVRYMARRMLISKCVCPCSSSIVYFIP